MSDFIFISFWVILCGLFILSLVKWKKIKHRLSSKQKNTEPESKSSIEYALYLKKFAGLGDEPVWRGVVLAKVNDFKKPRYVYENCAETEEYDASQGRVIGYRISPTLVIHSMVGSGNCWGEEQAYLFRGHYLGYFLEYEEVLVLRENWDIVSKMRTDIGDTPLPIGWFWADKGDLISLRPYHFKENEGLFTPLKCNVILKR